MDNTQREIRNEIEATRVDMVEKIATLEERVDCTIQGVKRSFDPQYQVKQHPWLAVGFSLAAGYLLSGLILGRPTPKAELVLPDDWNDGPPVDSRVPGMIQSLVGMRSGVRYRDGGIDGAGVLPQVSLNANTTALVTAMILILQVEAGNATSLLTLTAG